MRDTSKDSLSQRDPRVAEVGSRIRELIQQVIRVSNEVIEARKSIQQFGAGGEQAVQNVFAAEGKLWELIDLEAQLANELSQFRQLDTGTDDQYFAGVKEAEGKIRRLIEVETQLANEIGAWRAMTQNAPKENTSKTTLYKVPGAYSSSATETPPDALTPSSSSTGYTS